MVVGVGQSVGGWAINIIIHFSISYHSMHPLLWFYYPDVASIPYFGFIEEIWELNYVKFAEVTSQVPVDFVI